ncbi:MAG: hypothetical protein KAI64_06265 [Thermoplasmata archaeon]|nr:hypothetical protein [Thermoplasmata archaeon]
MRCRFDDGDVCQGKYKGFGCIKDKCALYARRCDHLVNEYCMKYKRFFCVGDEDCSTFENYMDGLRTVK